MKRPTKQQLNDYLGKNVTITLFDGDVLNGKLQITESDFDRFRKKGILPCWRKHDI